MHINSRIPFIDLTFVKCHLFQTYERRLGASLSFTQPAASAFFASQRYRHNVVGSLVGAGTQPVYKCRYRR